MKRQHLVQPLWLLKIGVYKSLKEITKQWSLDKNSYLRLIENLEKSFKGLE